MTADQPFSDFRKLFESVPGLYLILKPDFTIVAVTDAYLRATMTVRENILGRGLFEVFPDNPEDSQATGSGNLGASLKRVLQTGQADTMAVQKYDIRRPESEGGDFEVRYWSPMNSPILSETGAVEYLIHRVEDVTDFVHLKQLGTEQNRLNEELKSRAGHMEADIYRRAQELQTTNQQLRTAEEQVRTANEELEARVAERVEQLKQAEAQLQQLQKMDAIGNLAGGVAHDFNNILGAIKMYCDLLREMPEDSKMVAETAREIQLVSDRGAALTRQLLIFSRKQIVQTQSVDLNQLITGLLKMLNRLIGENIQIVTKFLPALDAIKVDPGQMEQVILNLVVNARDAMPQGGELTLETSHVELTEGFTSPHLNITPGPHVVLTVSDTGQGMTPETQSRLFEPFFTTKPIGKGTGLGLPTAYGIIKQSRGTIRVFSEVGKGSIFKIYIPTLGKPDVHVGHPISAISASTGSETILLVEDEDMLRTLYSKALKRCGYKVYEACNGKEALVVLKEYGSKIHLLLTDVVMPKTGGIELAKLARDLHPKLRVLYMSGYANDPVGSNVLNLEEVSHFFIQKPFDTMALVAKITQVLGN